MDDLTLSQRLRAYAAHPGGVVLTLTPDQARALADFFDAAMVVAKASVRRLALDDLRDARRAHIRAMVRRIGLPVAGWLLMVLWAAGVLSGGAP
jgi:hypothetical protein